MPPPRIVESGRWTEPRVAMSAVKRDVGGYGSAQPGLFAGLGYLPGSTGVPVTPYSALQVATVYACVDRLSKDIGKLPIQVRRRLSRGTALDNDHPLNRLFRTPNRWQTPSQCWGFYVWALALRGNGYAAILRGPAGEPREVLPISPDRTSVMLSQVGDVFYQFNHPALTPGLRLDADNVLHAKGMTMDGIMGLSPIFLAQDVAGLALAAQQHGATLFRQGAQLNGYIKHPNKLSPEGKDYLSTRFSQRFGGVQNAHGTPVLDEAMTFEKVAMTSEEAQFLETRGMQVLEICRLFGMPPHKVFSAGNDKFANLEMSEQQYVNDTLLPIGKQIEELCERNLLFEDERDRYEIRFNFDALMRADRKTRVETNARAIMSTQMTPNEARIDDNREPNVPNGDTFVSPSTMQATDKPLTADAEQEPT
jgi:HK97 family phage portal protein